MSANNSLFQQTRGRALSPGVINIFAGQEGRLFTFSRKTLQDFCSYFKEEFDRHHERDTVVTEYNFPNDSIRAFQILHNWLPDFYSLRQGCLTDVWSRADEQWGLGGVLISRMLDVYPLAHKLGCTKATDLAIEIMASECVRLREMPSFEECRTTYSNTGLVGSGLRRWMARHLAHMQVERVGRREILPPSALELSGNCPERFIMEGHPEMSQDSWVMVRDAFAQNNPMWLDHPEADPICMYHDHAIDELCPATGHRFDCEYWAFFTGRVCGHEQPELAQSPGFPDPREVPQVDSNQGQAPRPAEPIMGGAPGGSENETQQRPTDAVQLLEQLQNHADTVNTQSNITEASKGVALVTDEGQAAEQAVNDDDSDTSMGSFIVEDDASDGDDDDDMSEDDHDDDHESVDEDPDIPRQRRARPEPTRTQPSRRTHGQNYRPISLNRFLGGI